MSASLGPSIDDDQWSSFVTLLAPLLDFRMDLVEGGDEGVERRVSIRELVAHGFIEVSGELPEEADPGLDDTDSIRCGYPRI
jgi:hypothetical protein